MYHNKIRRFYYEAYYFHDFDYRIVVKRKRIVVAETTEQWGKGPNRVLLKCTILMLSALHKMRAL